MVFRWSLSDSKSPQDSRTPPSILAVLSNAVIWIVYTCPRTSKSSRHFNRHFHVPQFFQFPSKVEVLILLFTFFQINSVVSWKSKVHNFANSFFLLTIIRSGLLAETRWSVCMSKSHKSLYVSFSRTGAVLLLLLLLFSSFLITVSNRLFFPAVWGTTILLRFLVIDSLNLQFPQFSLFFWMLFHMFQLPFVLPSLSFPSAFWPF